MENCDKYYMIYDYLLHMNRLHVIINFVYSYTNFVTLLVVILPPIYNTIRYHCIYTLKRIEYV